MTRPGSRAFARLFVLAAMVFCMAVPVSLAQNADDDLFDEIRRQKKRERAVAEGRDPDAVDEEEINRVPTDVQGWITFIQRRYNSEREGDAELLDECIEKLTAAMAESTDVKARVKRSFDGFKEREAERVLARAVRDSGVTVERLRRVLEQGRPVAIRAIFNGAYDQNAVDAATAPLFAVWRDPVGYAIEHLGLDLTSTADDLVKLTATLTRVDESLGRWTLEGNEGVTDPASYMRAKGAEMFDIREREYRANRRTLDNNEAMSGRGLTDEDKRHVRVLNDYRMMIGRAALPINLALSDASARHSRYMEQIGQLAHNIDGHPDGRTPQDRARRCGYNGSVAENCLVGATCGDAAVWQWYRSEGHHRNMLGIHSAIGVGHSGVYWTQKFGTSNSNRGG